MTRIFNSEIECSNEVQRLKLLQKQHPLRPEVIPPELANSFQWIVWSYEIAERKNGKFGPDKTPYQARRPWVNSSRRNASDWSDLATALQCAKENPHIDGIGYFFSKNDGLTGVDFDNCRDSETGRIRKEYVFWIKKLDGYTEVSPSGTGIKVWVKGTADNKYFRNDESTGFRIQGFADGNIEIYRQGQYFTVTTRYLEGFEYIKSAQEELDVLSAFYHSHTRNTLWDWVSGECKPDMIENLEDGTIPLWKNTLWEGWVLGEGKPDKIEEDEIVRLWNEDSDNYEKTLTEDSPFIGPASYIGSNNDKTNLKEKDSEFWNRASQIEQFCKEREITTLCHFTRIENLHSILQEGLLGRNLLETRGQQFLFNDHDRVDGHKEAVCMSISFPNYQMFYSIRESKKETEGVSDSQWVVLFLKADLLWELDCAFCTENAASNAIRHVPLEERGKPDVLENMFVTSYHDTKGNFYQRHSQTPTYYPTHPQAEVLVFDTIPIEYIQAVHFHDATVLEDWRDSNPWINPERLVHNQQYFRNRPHYVAQQHDIR